MAAPTRIDVDKPLWDLTTFLGRLKYFAWMTDYRTCIYGKERLEEAKKLLEQYRVGEEPAGTRDEDVKYAMKLCKSAFHPDSGELQNFIGRMSFQVPGGMIITAGMLQFYKTNGAVILWQWINQSFNALVNYTNRNAESSMSEKQLLTSYITATTSAVVTALGLKRFLATRASPLMQRFVPFAAVAAANMVNIPFTRQSELINGVALRDEDGNKITDSKYAAVKGISQVTFSRITIAAPGMCVMPLIMESLEKRPWFSRYPALHLPFQTIMIGAFLTVMVPVGCSLFNQNSSIKTERLAILDKENYEDVKVRFGNSVPSLLYFNKGL